MKTEFSWIEGPWPGRLAISARPRGGDWLEEELRSWKDAGVDALVSLLTKDEEEELTLVEERTRCREVDVEFLSFPVEDRGVPVSHDDFSTLIGHLTLQLQSGRTVVVHCRQGIGRAALVAIGVLLAAGTGFDQAVERVSKARRCSVPETAEQRRWIAGFAASRMTAPTK